MMPLQLQKQSSADIAHCRLIAPPATMSTADHAPISSWPAARSDGCALTNNREAQSNRGSACSAPPFVNIVAELGSEDRKIEKIATVFKEGRSTSARGGQEYNPCVVFQLLACSNWFVGTIVHMII